RDSLDTDWFVVEVIPMVSACWVVIFVTIDSVFFPKPEIWTFCVWFVQISTIIVVWIYADGNDDVRFTLFLTEISFVSLVLVLSLFGLLSSDRCKNSCLRRKSTAAPLLVHREKIAELELQTSSDSTVMINVKEQTEKPSQQETSSEEKKKHPSKTHNRKKKKRPSTKKNPLKSGPLDFAMEGVNPIASNVDLYDDS